MISKGIQKLTRQLGQKKYRSIEGLFVAEGPKVVGDLLRSGFKARYLYTTPSHSDAIASAINKEGTSFEVVTDEDIAKISFLQHPQGVVGIFHIPEPHTASITNNDLSLMLDGIQDPGNLGTII